MGDFTIWGRPARGLDLRNYTDNTLQFIGGSDDGDSKDQFYCQYNESTDTLSFGVKLVSMPVGLANICDCGPQVPPPPPAVVLVSKGRSSTATGS